ncbi:MAG: hypothetical protein Q8P15_03900 [Nanoarchaeota archaeon]|nr:hypothetical protein [Nanoarchaeota archaeon]
MTKFVCRRCNYKFEAEKPKKECPYCGEKDIVKELSAEDIVEIS